MSRQRTFTGFEPGPWEGKGIATPSPRPPEAEHDPGRAAPSPTGPAWPDTTGVRPTRPLRTRWNLILFLLTLASVTYWGFLQYQEFYLRTAIVWNPLRLPEALLGGLPFGLAVIAFLLSHEMGHYLACRYYGIRATLPYFIPIPAPIAPLLPGTMGAVIRIVSPITSRRALFDIAVAGPIAGFVVALPILATGLTMSRIVPTYMVEGGGYITMGEPLIWGVMSAWFGPETGAGRELVVHPLAYVGWFAMLVTAMNLLPVGQLDGGHLLYALFPRAHRLVSLLVLAAMFWAGLTYFPGWIVFALVIFLILGTRHPRPQAFEASLGAGRLAVAALSIAILLSSFILVPVSLPELVP